MRCAPLAPFAFLLLGGCALPVAPVALRPHLEPGVPDGVPPERPRLGVGAVVDARSPLDREGYRPPLEWRWHGLVRYGENRTGDASFDGDVAEAVRIDTAATLARSGAFSSVRLVAVDEARAARGELPEGVDLVLTTALTSLAGTQIQDSVMSAAIVGWFRNRLGPPVGVASLSYRLWDRGGLRFETAFDTRVVGRGEIGAAALDALARTSERLALRLHREIVPAGERRRRLVPVRVLDGCGEGEARTAALVNEASAVFEREIGLTLVGLRDPWKPPRSVTGLESALAFLGGRTPPRGGFLLAFVPLPDVRRGGERRFGLARQLGDRAAVGCVAGAEISPLTVLHEIAHLFGAVHVRDRSSVMHPEADFEARFFDRLNARILAASADRPFGRRLPAPLVSELSSIYREARGNTRQIYVDEIDAALHAAGLRALPPGEPESER